VLHCIQNTILCTRLLTENHSPCKFRTHLTTWSDNNLLCGYRRQYSAAAALPFSLQKPYINAMPAYCAVENVRRIVNRTSVQHNASHSPGRTIRQPLAAAAVPPRRTALARNSITESNQPMVYTTFLLEVASRTRSLSLLNTSRNTLYGEAFLLYRVSHVKLASLTR
jgi:hypothetical protein